MSLWSMKASPRTWARFLRHALWTPEQTREYIARIASELDHRAGRQRRSLQSTANAAQLLYFSPPQWASERRSVDFYPEAVLIWLDVDTTIRKLTQDRRSMNDFCHLSYAGSEDQPIIKTYTFDDVVATLNQVTPYNWRSFLRQRLDSAEAHAPLDGISRGGWQLIYNFTTMIPTSSSRRATPSRVVATTPHPSACACKTTATSSMRFRACLANEESEIGRLRPD